MYYVLKSQQYRYFTSEKEAIAHKTHPRDKIYKCHSRADAERLFHNIDCDHLEFTGDNPRDMRVFHSVKYEDMPMYHGTISAIPKCTNSLQLCVHENRQFGYVAYIIYNHYQAEFFVQNIDYRKSLVELSLDALIRISSIYFGVSIGISMYAISKVFTEGWVYRWKRENICVSNLNKWVHLQQTLRTRNMKINHHPPLLIESFITRRVEFEIFRRYSEVLKKHNFPEYLKYNHLYYEDPESKIPGGKDIVYKELSHLSKFI